MVFLKELTDRETWLANMSKEVPLVADFCKIATLRKAGEEKRRQEKGGKESIEERRERESTGKAGEERVKEQKTKAR